MSDFKVKLKCSKFCFREGRGEENGKVGNSEELAPSNLELWICSGGGEEKENGNEESLGVHVQTLLFSL